MRTVEFQVESKYCYFLKQLLLILGENENKVALFSVTDHNRFDADLYMALVQTLSDSVLDAKEIIKVGYINALEFQKPTVEGILINNLNNLALPTPLFSGSDCHDWNCYPYHDANNKNIEFHHSKAKILPTFKGLLMAVTSPETRFNCRDNLNKTYFDGIHLGDKFVPIV